MEISLDLLLPRDAASVPTTRRILDAALQTLGVEEEICGDVGMMLSEACTNAIEHAEHGADYTVRATIRNRRCLIQVIDAGGGFDADLVSDPAPGAEHGRGLMIMRTLADDVRFGSLADDGARVSLEKWLDYGEGSLGGLLVAESRTADASADTGEDTDADAEAGEAAPELAEFTARLFELARAGDTGALVAFVDAGVPVDLSDDQGDTLLMLAACHGHPDTVRALTDRGADPERPNDRGQRPLAGAVLKQEPDVVRALLDAGADPRASTPSAVDTARMFGSTRFLEWFEEAPPPSGG